MSTSKFSSRPCLWQHKSASAFSLPVKPVHSFYGGKDSDLGVDSYEPGSPRTETPARGSTVRTMSVETEVSTVVDVDSSPCTPRDRSRKGSLQTGKSDKRKSRLGSLWTSFLPTLTNQLGKPVLRKPAPGTGAGECPPTTPCDNDKSFSTFDFGLAKPSPSLSPDEPVAPVEPERTSPLSERVSEKFPSHRRSQLMPKKVLKKKQKAQIGPERRPQSASPPVLPSLSSSPTLGPSRQSEIDLSSCPMESGDTSGSPSLLSAEQQPVQPQSEPAFLQSQTPSPEPRGHRSVSSQVLKNQDSLFGVPRFVSNPIVVPSPPDAVQTPGGGSDKGRLRKSWMPGHRSRSSSADLGKANPAGAWILSPDATADYTTAPLVNGEKVPELWSEAGNIVVFLHPRESDRGPCFKVSDRMLKDSAAFDRLLFAELANGNSSSTHDAGDLYLQIPNADVDRLVAVRNLFAFLMNQPLVGTTTQPSAFAALLKIASLLVKFEFRNHDDSNFGESVEQSLDYYMNELGIADVRHSREKTLEGLILGEQLRSWDLYNEAYCHAVGNYEKIAAMKSPLYKTISVNTRNRLEKAHFDLVKRQQNVNSRLEIFEFPALFAGVANSTSTDEYKTVRFKEWRASFYKMRNFALAYYKDLFGSWPPKARSKKNHFSQNGLNRQCLKILYSDLCALYDLLVDRESLTTRMIDQSPDEVDECEDIDPRVSALRKILSEFDTSSPPVLPPIPYDVPKIPSLKAIYENYNEMPLKKQAKLDKAIKPHELLLILLKARNIDTDALSMPFLDAFKDFELREAKGATPHDLADQRFGVWIFLYAAIQSLPMLVVDAPGLRYTEGVEYFLCEPPQGNLPWMEDASEVRKMWYQTADKGIVELSADVVMFSVEATYNRSHCWLAAKKWQESGGSAPAPQQESSLVISLIPPPPVFRDNDPVSHPSSAPNSPHLRPRNTSPASRSLMRASIAGLEPLLSPDARTTGDRASRAVSIASGRSMGSSMRPSANRKLSESSSTMANESSSSTLCPTRDTTSGGSTFDDILKGMEPEKKPKKKFLF